MEIEPKDPFSIVRTIGREGPLTTYEAVETDSNRVIIIQALQKNEENAAFLKEIEGLKNCDSKYVLKYHGFYEKENEYWCITEKWELKSLKRCLYLKGVLKEKELSEIASCCLMALDFLHSRNIVHGSINPSNLFLTEDGVVKVGNSGFASLLCRVSDRNNYRIYFAPELLDGRKEPKSDMWSLGMTLIELAEKKNPFGDFSWNVWENKCIMHPIRLSNKKWSAEFIDFVHKCVIWEVEKRASVHALMEHPFVRDSLERIRRDGCCKELRRWAQKWKIEKLGRILESAGNGYTWPRLSDSNPYYEGVVEMSGSAMAELSLDRVIEVSVDSHELLRVNGEEVSGIEHAQVLNLSDDGERWEGDVLNDEPYGWGVYYDSENRMVYEGFRMGEMNVCFGTRYYSDIGVMGSGTTFQKRGSPFRRFATTTGCCLL